ncbi:lipocalin family protein [Dyella sp.]|jgi:apolipoprotein D and lipocalin family protein|uniref:lipocalin family protein n=1 Tax=Dyella sp. TaxID=1869338 RepID=UPI002D77ECF8|nr:lipocalin family protein [Dyella sp.]HET6431394.1 lipocalin family protein [Dyella sp.]
MSRFAFPSLAVPLSAAMAATPRREPAPMQAVPQLPLERLAGAWHEIARLPSPLQQADDKHITLRFEVLGDGALQVERRSQQRDGTPHIRQAAVRRRHPIEEPGQLEFANVPAWLRWWSGAWSERWVLALAPGGEWMMLGAPDRDQLWLLAREPTMERNVLETLKAKARGLGYDLAPLIISGQLRSFQPL